MGCVCTEEVVEEEQTKLTKDSTITLNNGVKIPIVGLGTWGGASYDDQGNCTQNQISEGVNFKAVTAALKAGYRHIDTATYYFNEEEVGEANEWPYGRARTL